MRTQKQISLFRKVFESPEGAEVLTELENFALANEAEYISDVHLAAYYQGRRSVVCEIRKIIGEKEIEQLQN